MTKRLFEHSHNTHKTKGMQMLNQLIIIIPLFSSPQHIEKNKFAETIPYSSFSIEKPKLKNTLDFNTISTEELVRENNEKILKRIYENLE